MTDVEREESRKTVVAFITGLLIGGLLVWIFSSTPSTNAPTGDVDDDEELVDDNRNTGTSTGRDDEDEEENNDNSSFSVEDQAAGNRVQVGTVDFPGETGWIVVRDYDNGEQGRILGAARYDEKADLLPSSVGLIRNTIAGEEYLVMFYTSEGALGFNSGEDKPLEGGATATFTAK